MAEGQGALCRLEDPGLVQKAVGAASSSEGTVSFWQSEPWLSTCTAFAASLLSNRGQVIFL